MTERKLRQQLEQTRSTAKRQRMLKSLWRLSNPRSKRTSTSRPRP